MPARATPVPFDSLQLVTSNAFDGAEAVVAADLDGDGDLDVLGAAGVAGAIAWWENVDGQGGAWIEHVVDGAIPGAVGLAAADVDGDGDLDVLGAAGGASDTIAWWENTDGLGSTWTLHVVDSGFGGARSVAAGDVDGDGDLDLLGAAADDDSLVWWQNQGGRGTNWIKRTVDASFDGASSVFGADLDGDGDLDLAGAASAAGEVSWWANSGGAGTNWTKHIVDDSFHGARAAHAADVDGDGDVDLVGVATNRIAWWENVDGLGSQWTARVVVASFSGGRSVATADLDGDGDTDILGAADIADDVTWFENVGGRGTNWIARVVDGSFDGARSAALADLDGDGDPDVLAAAFIADAVAWWGNKTLHRSASFCLEVVVDLAFDGAQGVAVVDRDRDGDLDVVGASFDMNRVSWWENADGAGGVWLERSVDTNVQGAWAVVAADVNGDGVPDIVGAARGANTIAWWETPDDSGLDWTSRVVDASFGQARSVAAADLDRDGAQDVVGAAYGDGEISWWRNVGGSGTNWLKHVVESSFAGAAAVTTADFNGDGRPDIAGAAFFLDRVAWWENADDAATNWIARVVANGFGGATAIHATDLDRDGDVDLLGAAFNGDRIAWWENVGGTGTNWIEHVVDGALDGANAVSAADLDGDGDLDVLGGSAVVNRFAWWENVDGSGTNWVRRDLAFDILDAAALVAADVDRDGDLDVLGASPSSSGPVPDLLWWKNEGGQFALSGADLAPPLVLQGTTNAVLAVTVAHHGRPGDGDAELASLAVLFEELAGDPLSSAEGNGYVQDLKVYSDDGSGLFETNADTLVTAINDLILDGGTQTVTLVDGDPLLQIAAATSRTYFVVLVLATNAGQFATTTLRVSLPEAAAAGVGPAEDRTYDLALSRACGTGAVVSAMDILTMADVATFKTATPGILALDSNVLFTLTVTNRSGAFARGVVVTDALPPSVTFMASGSSPQWAVTGGVLVCNLGTLTGRQSRVLTVAVSVAGTAYGALTNRATASTLSVDTNLADNTGTAVVLLPDTDLDGDADFHDPDDDDDGMPDAFELQHGFDRTNAADAAAHADDDGFSNLEEYIADTDPTNGLSLFWIEKLAGPGPAQVYFPSSTGRVYTLQYTAQPLLPAWADVAGQVDQPGNGAQDVLIDAASDTGRIYRLRVKLP